MATLIQSKKVEVVQKAKSSVSIVMPLYNVGDEADSLIRQAVEKYSSMIEDFELIASLRPYLIHIRYRNL